MKCESCMVKGVIDEHHDFEWDDPFAGRLTITNAPVRLCPNCGRILALLDEASEKIEEAADARIEEWVNAQPFSALLTSAQAHQALGISRQALHSNQRINAGFVFSTTRDGKKFYHRRSLELFRETQDGRFNIDSCDAELHNHEVDASPHYRTVVPAIRNLEGQSVSLRYFHVPRFTKKAIGRKTRRQGFTLTNPGDRT